MKKTVKALSKQLFGAKYESAGKSVLVCGILYFAISSAEIRLTIQPFILYLTSWVFTWCVMGQILHGSRMAEILEGMLKLPFVNRELTFSYVLVLGGYTLITRTMPVSYTHLTLPTTPYV